MTSRSIGGRGRRRTRIALWCASLTALTALAGAPAGLAAATDPPGPPGDNPGDRRFEKVTPHAKGGTDVSGDKIRSYATASADGGLVYSTLGTFPGSRSAGRPSFYLGDRGGAGWLTSPLLPDFDATIAVGGQGFGLTALLHATTPQLDRAVVATNEAIAPGSNGEVLSLYLQDNRSGSGYVNLTPNGPTAIDALMQPAAVPQYHNSSPDLSHVVWASAYKFTPDATDYTLTPEVDVNLYETVDGEVRLVSYLPGEVPVSEVQAQPIARDFAGAGTHPHVVSADGSRIFWSLPGTGLYVRKDGVETEQLQTGGGTFGAANPEGSKVLIAGGPVPYLYDVDAHQIEEILPPGAQGRPLLASEELDYIYFLSEETLVPGQPPVVPNDEPWPRSYGLYLWHDGEIRHIVNGSYPENDWFLETAGTLDRLDASYAGRSTDGRKFAFSTRGELAGIDNGGKEQAYVYDASTDELVCASCPAAGTPTATGALVRTDSGGSMLYYSTALGPRYNVSADGSRVFFQTANRLVPEDVNGRIDVYVWEGGQAHLVSTGKGEHDARFVAASPSGGDAFLATAGRLVGSDADDIVDIYDARVGGGYPESLRPTPECVGDGCQGQPAGGPDTRSPASESIRQSKPSLAIGSSKRCNALATKARKAQRRSLTLGRRAAKRTGAQRKRLVRAQRQQVKRARKLQRQARACLRSAK